MCRCVSYSVMSDSLRPHGLWPTRTLHPQDFPGKNTGVGCHVLLQGIILTQGSNTGLQHCRQILYRLSHQGSPVGREWHPPQTQFHSLDDRDELTLRGREEQPIGLEVSSLWPSGQIQRSSLLSQEAFIGAPSCPFICILPRAAFPLGWLSRLRAPEDPNMNFPVLEKVHQLLG